MIQHLLHINHVSKHFGGNVAVSDISFSVDEKQIFGLIEQARQPCSTAFQVFIL